MLSGKEKRQLRATGNKLKPEVWVGKEGISPGLITTLVNTFNTKEVVKVKLQENCPLEKSEVADQLASAVTAEVVQIMGNTILLYRPRPDSD